MRFYLGTHKPEWLGRLDVPLFVSIRSLRERKVGGRALAPWALDSGGFTELEKHGGRWATPAATYAAEVERFAAEVGGLEWAVPQDWICAPPVLAATGLTVLEHQVRSIASVHEMRSLVAGTYIVPVLQGASPADYWRCVEMYDDAGIDLRAERVVAVGSIAARQGRPEVARLIRELAAAGIALHGLGVKVRGWVQYADVLASADSAAWSFDARRAPALPGCSHRSCSNCSKYALRWRADLLRRPVHSALF